MTANRSNGPDVPGRRTPGTGAGTEPGGGPSAVVAPVPRRETAPGPVVAGETTDATGAMAVRVRSGSGGAAPEAEDRWPDEEIGALMHAAEAAPRTSRTRGWWIESADQSLLLRTGMTPDRAGRPGLLRRTRISAGAALFGMRLAVARRGYRAHTTLLPDPTRPGVLAALRRGRREPATPFQRELYAVLGTNDVRSVEVPDAAVLYALRRAAGIEGTWSRTTADPAEVGRGLPDGAVTRADEPVLYVTVGAEGEPATADLRIGLALQQMLLTAAVMGRRAQLAAMYFEPAGAQPGAGPPRLLVTLDGARAPSAAQRGHQAAQPAGSADSRPA